jgi:hypothetical protein
VPNVLPNVRLTRRILVVAAALGTLGAGVAACGGGSSSASSGSSTTSASSGASTTAPSASRTASFQKYTQCLTSHGVPSTVAGGLFGRRPGGATGSGTGSGATPSSPPSSRPAGTRPTIPAQYQSAFQACNSLRPTFGGGGFGAGGGGLNSAQFAAYRNCLQIHGVTLPSTPTTTPGQPPTSGAGRGGFGGLANNPTFQAAAKACANLLPARTGSSTTTTVPAAA